MIYKFKEGKKGEKERMRCRQGGREERREKEREKKKEAKKEEENGRALSLAHKSTMFLETLTEKALPRGGAPLLYKSLRNFEPRRAVVWDDT